VPGTGCVDVSRDPNNCGSVGNQCGDAELCSSGACVCRPGLTLVGGNCIDLQTDPNNCGTAGTMCPDICSAGVCATVCRDPRRECDGACVDVRSDPLNCGDCGDNCASDELCSDGNCREYAVATGCTTCPCAAVCVGDLSECCNYPASGGAPICARPGTCP